ncbi:MAG: transketolase family protein [Candidatus Humimicrobiaceae bacterium]
MFDKKQIQADAVDKLLMEAAQTDARILALSADMADRIIPKFARNFKDKFINCGIAEQNMIGIAAGLAKSGFIPFVTTLAVFLSLRCLEQIRTDLAYSKSNVKIIASGGGLVYGTLGATHQGLEDISIMKSIINLVVMAPADYVETVCAIKAAIKYEGPVYIRLGRGAVPTIYKEEEIQDFEIGKAIKLREGDDVSIIATGVMVAKALEAADKLKNDKIDVSVYSMHTLKPLDEGAILEASKSKFGIITVEDNNICGGLGEAVALVTSQNNPVKIKSIAIPDTYPIIGETDDLYKYYKMDTDSIVDCAHKILH